MSSSEPRSTGWRQGLPGRSWAGGMFNKGRQGRRELVRVKAKKAWKGSDAGFLDQSFKKAGGGNWGQVCRETPEINANCGCSYLWVPIPAALIRFSLGRNLKQEESLSPAKNQCLSAVR